MGIFSSITWIQISTTFTYLTLPTLPPYLEDCEEIQSTIFYFNENIKNVDIYVHTTTITAIPNNNINEYTKQQWSSYPRTSKSQLRRRKSEMLYVSVSHPIPSHPFINPFNSNSSSSSTFPISPPGQFPKVPINLLELARLKLQKQAQKEKLQAILSSPVMS